MIIDCSAGVIVKVFMPYKVHYHVVSEYPMWIHNEQSEDVKLFHRQRNLSFTDIHNSILQAEIQIFSLDFC